MIQSPKRKKNKRMMKLKLIKYFPIFRTMKSRMCHKLILTKLMLLGCKRRSTITCWDIGSCSRSPSVLWISKMPKTKCAKERSNNIWKIWLARRGCSIKPVRQKSRSKRSRRRTTRTKSGRSSTKTFRSRYPSSRTPSTAGTAGPKSLAKTRNKKPSFSKLRRP